MAENHTLTPLRYWALKEYYPILVKIKSPITYGVLRQRVSPTAQRIVPQAMGAPLEFYRLYTVKRNLPDLSRIMISKAGHIGRNFNLAKNTMGTLEKDQEWCLGFEWPDDEMNVFFNQLEDLIGKKREDIARLF